MTDERKYDERDLRTSVTDSESGSFFGQTVLDLVRVLEIADFPTDLLSFEEKKRWISQGKQLSLAAGSGTGELSFASKLGIDPQRITLIDQKIPNTFNPPHSLPVKYLEASLQNWSADVLRSSMNEAQNDRANQNTFRMITLFGAEYAFDADKMSDLERKLFVQAVATSLEPGGILYIAPEIREFEEAFLQAGLKRIDLEEAQVFQKKA